MVYAFFKYNLYWLFDTGSWYTKKGEKKARKMEKKGENREKKGEKKGEKKAQIHTQLKFSGLSMKECLETFELNH